ncbi:retrovirus-related Pol polyprotein from transposon TNT 1-94, partial [Trifolium medium]|nr:retrovirus-related Pol polyprotein from transposon TNT 1-94 [Trifolium medium]
VPILAADANAEQTRIVNEARLKDLKAKNYLFQSIDRTIIETILDKSSSKAIWDSMKHKFQGSTKVKRAQLQALRGEFETLRMKEDESVNDYFGRVLATVNKMKIQGETMEQRIVVEKILRSMTRKFNYVVCAIEESNNVETLSIDELQGSLLVHEQKMKPVKEEEQALKVAYGERNSSSARGRGRNTKGNQGRDYANYAEFDDTEEVLLMAFDSSPPEHHKSKVWFIDSGCSNHMCGVKEWFFDFDPNFRETVKSIAAKGPYFCVQKKLV